VQLLTDVLAYAVKPCYLNQVEMHPYNTQRELLDFFSKNGVKVTAFSPLGSPSYVELGMDQKLNIMTEDCIVNMATKHAKSSAQILLRWAVQRGTSLVTKSSQMSRIKENAAIFDFALSVEEVCMHVVGRWRWWWRWWRWWWWWCGCPVCLVFCPVWQTTFLTLRCLLALFSNSHARLR
jgi:diketogulonate reductase-like aldo/keto reductase